MRSLAVALLILTACASRPAKHPTHSRRPTATSTSTGDVQQGLATWYGKEQHGGPTASGERFDRHKMTAAHRTLKMGTRVRVTNLKNGRTVEVRINDRGPYGSARRIIDVSEAAARQLGMIDAGVVPVKVEVVR